MKKIDVINHWKTLKLDPRKLKSDVDNLHQAAQLVAMAGKYFIPETTDDSHTASRWIPEKDLQLGNLITAGAGKHNFHVGLNYPDFALQILSTDSTVLTSFPLNGKTFAQAFQWLWKQMEAQGLDAGKLLPKMHFDIPDHPVKNGEPFRVEDFNHMQELAHHRTNGHLLHEYFGEVLHRDETIFIWPHHFDEGLYLPLTFEGEAPTSSISFGLAMPDVYYPEPYFYITAWQKEDVIDMKNVKSISPGHWHSKDWSGQVLETHIIIQAEKTASGQATMTIDFLQKAVNNALSMVSSKQQI